MLSFQSGLLHIALPVIRADLVTGIAGIQAVSLSGLAVITATLVVCGRLADLLGAKRVYTSGLVCFSAGGAASAAAPTTGWLVAAQAAQGVGWSMAVASGTALLVRVFRPDQRSRILAAQHSAIAVGLAAGPASGGVVVDALGWRTAFAGLAALGGALAVFAFARLPDPERPAQRPRFELGGPASLAVALLGLLLLVNAGGGSLGAGATTVLAAGTTTALAVFVVAELRSPDPVVDLRLFARRGFSAGLAASFLDFIAMAAHMFLLPFVLQDHLGQRAAEAGAVLITAPVVILLAAPLAGTVADRSGARVPATAGLALVTAAVALMGTFDPATPTAWVVAVLAVYGLGAAFFQSPNNSAVLGAVPPDRIGVATGTLATVGRLGQVTGIAVAGATWQAGLERYGADALGPAFRDAFLVLSAFGVLAMAASWLRGPAVTPGEAGTQTLPGGH